MPWNLEGRVAVVTGASSGIGRQLATRLASEHRMRPVCVSRRNLTGLFAPDCRCMQSDITVPDACDALMRSVRETIGPVALLVNCAGVTLNKMHVRSTDLDYDAVMDVNLRGSLHLTRAALRHGGMLASGIGDGNSGGGCVVHIGSVVGNAGNEGQVLYGASKAALSGAVRSLAREYGSRNLRFNVVAPGLVEGEGMGAALTASQREDWRSRCPMGRLATVEDVVDAIIFVSLCRFINGQTIVVDGGLS